MTLGDFPQIMGGYLLAQLGAGAIGLLGAIAIAVRLVLRKPTPVALGVLPILIPASVVFASSLIGLAGATGADPASAVVLNLGSRLLGWVWMWPACGVVLLGAAIGGARSPQRRFGLALTVGVLGLLVAALPWGYGWPQGDYVPTWVRSVLYIGVAFLVAVASLGDEEDDTKAGPEAGAIAAVVAVWFVAGGEMFLSGLCYAGLFIAFPTVESHQFDAYYEASWERVFSHIGPWDALTILVSAAIAMLVIGLAARKSSRRVRVLTGVPLVLMAPLLYFVGVPSSEALRALFDAMQ